MLTTLRIGKTRSVPEEGLPKPSDGVAHGVFGASPRCVPAWFWLCRGDDGLYEEFPAGCPTFGGGMSSVNPPSKGNREVVVFWSSETGSISGRGFVSPIQESVVVEEQFNGRTVPVQDCVVWGLRIGRGSICSGS